MQTKSLRIGGPALAIILAVVLVSPAGKAETVLFRGTPSQAFVAQIMLDLQNVARKAGELTYMKREFSDQIADARLSVNASCVSGTRDQASEARLVGLLRDKDLYYLFFYMQSGQAATSRAVTAVDIMTGGKLDNGIRPSAEFAFARWALQIKAALGTALFRDENALESALRNSEASYVDYLIFRNEAEIEELTRNLNRPVVEPAPGDLANAYVDAVLQPAIEDQKDITADDAAALHQWAEDVRAAIVAYEKFEPTPEALVEYLRKRQNYPERALQIFLQRANHAREHGQMNQAWLFREYHELRDQIDATRGIRPLNPGPPKALEVLRMKFATDPAPVNRMEYLVDKFHLARVNLQPSNNYIAVRQWLIDHRLTQTVDWCTGQPLK
jgi:hypothetical protein